MKRLGGVLLFWYNFYVKRICIEKRLSRVFLCVFLQKAADQKEKCPKTRLASRFSDKFWCDYRGLIQTNI